jgi:hypothetical protein
MKYWGYLLAKFAGAFALLWAIGYGAGKLFPKPSTTFWNQRQDPFAHDLTYTTAMMVYFLLTVGVIYLVIWDQRYRCRTCLRKLRMPVSAGSWPNMFLKGQPRMEYICIYGHGTLKVPEVELTGPKTMDWQPHNDDIWKELEALGTGDRR